MENKYNNRLGKWIVDICSQNPIPPPHTHSIQRCSTKYCNTLSTKSIRTSRMKLRVKDSTYYDCANLLQQCNFLLSRCESTYF